MSELSFLVVRTIHGGTRVEVGEVWVIKRAVETYMKDGTDTLLELATPQGTTYRVAASAIIDFQDCTPESRALHHAHDKELDEEAPAWERE